MHAHVTLLHAWHIRTPKGPSATPKTTYARKRGMPHATMPKTAFPHVRVSKDTVLAEIELEVLDEEAGKGPPIPAKPFNLKCKQAWARPSADSCILTETANALWGGTNGDSSGSRQNDGNRLVQSS